MSNMTLIPGVELDWLQRSAPALARDIVLGVGSAAGLAQQYGLTPGQWDALRITDFFKGLVSGAVTDLKGKDARSESIRVKALYTVDTVGVISLAEIVTNPNTSSGAKIDAMKELKDLAGLSKKDAVQGATILQPLIQINMTGREPRVVGGSVIDVQPELIQQAS